MEEYIDDLQSSSLVFYLPVLLETYGQLKLEKTKTFQHSYSQCQFLNSFLCSRRLVFAACFVLLQNLSLTPITSGYSCQSFWS